MISWLLATALAAGPVLQEDRALSRRRGRACRLASLQLPEVEPVLLDVLDGTTPEREGDGDDPRGVRLSVATWNLGLLYFFGGYSVPKGEERREPIAAAIAAAMSEPGGLDVLGLQEIYEPADVRLVQEAAESVGARIVDVQPYEGALSGLLFVVREERIDVSSLRAGFHPLPSDGFAAAGYVRGGLWVDVTLESGARARVVDMHLSPTSRADLSWRRTEQVMQLVADLSEPGLGLRGGRELPVVLMGDFNLAPAWSWQDTPDARSWTERQRQRAERWLRWDTVLYDMLVYSTDAGVPAEVGPSLDAANPLWEGYRWGAGESTRRVDHVFAVGAGVDGVSVRWHEPVDGLMLSDHYGVAADVWLPRASALPSYSAGSSR